MIWFLQAVIQCQLEMVRQSQKRHLCLENYAMDNDFKLCRGDCC